VGDLRSDEDAQGVADQALSALGGVDILINNAGVYASTTWTNGSSAGWAGTCNTNVISEWIIRLLLPQMRQLSWGRIIQNGSGEAMQPFSFMPNMPLPKQP